jgi:hypothetical protein
VFSSLAIAIPVVTVAMVSASAAPDTNGNNSATAKSELEMDISGNGSTFVEGEPEIAVNSANSSNLLIDWTTFTYDPFFSPTGRTATDAAVSNNGGQSWQPVDLGLNGGPFGSGDAVTAAGPDGTLYAGSGAETAVTAPGPVGGFTIHGQDLVTRSTDGGKTWSPAVVTMGSDAMGINNPRFVAGSGTPADTFDRPWLTVDQSTGTVYATGHNIVDHEGFVTASIDQAQSFGPIYAIDSDEYPQSSSGLSGTTAAARGVLAVAYTASAAAGAVCPCVIFETSTDQGATFSRHVVPVVNASSSPEPFLAADPVGRGRFALTILDATGTENQVYTTDDYGQSWQGPTLVGEAPANQRFKPWLSYGPSGQLALMWRTLHSDHSYDVWAAVGRQEGQRGAAFTAPLRVSSVAAPYPAHCSLGGLFGPTTCFGDDFSFITTDHQYVHVGWGDSRNVPADGGVQTWYARIPLAAFKGQQG